MENKPNERDELMEGLAPVFGFFGSHKILNLIESTTPKKLAGRKRLHPERVKVTSFSLDTDTIQKIRWYANVNGISQSDLIRQVINDYFR